MIYWNKFRKRIAAIPQLALKQREQFKFWFCFFFLKKGNTCNVQIKPFKNILDGMREIHTLASPKIYQILSNLLEDLKNKTILSTHTLFSKLSHSRVKATTKCDVAKRKITKFTYE